MFETRLDMTSLYALQQCVCFWVWVLSDSGGDLHLSASRPTQSLGLTGPFSPTAPTPSLTPCSACNIIMGVPAGSMTQHIKVCSSPRQSYVLSQTGRHCIVPVIIQHLRQRKQELLYSSMSDSAVLACYVAWSNHSNLLIHSFDGLCICRCRPLETSG